MDIFLNLEIGIEEKANLIYDDKFDVKPTDVSRFI